jgi:catechol 2,3-dioxygenase-like lactoylglutathione lyase family enzyme
LASYFRHIALVVPDLQEAEQYYLNLFGMELLGREAMLEDGLWYTLPHELDWKDAEAAGIELHMLALRKDDAVLALFPGPQPPGQVFSIGLAMPWEEVEKVKRRLPEDVEVLLDRPDQFHFRDPYGVSWQLVPPGTGFIMNGDASGRWLEI